MIKGITIEEKSFEDLMGLFNRNTFAVPNIQRDFVWTKQKILTLLDSIYNHYPIGSFLICRVPAKKHKKVKEQGVLLPQFNYQKNKKCFVIVDGQQRLSVLYSLLKGKTVERCRYKDGINFSNIYLSKNLENERQFEFYKKERQDYVKLTDILSGNIYVKGRKLKRAKLCKERFEKYRFAFIFIEDFDEDTMKKAFVRLNTGGTPLSTEDTVFAQAYHKDTDLRAHITDLVHQKLQNGFQNLDKIHLHIIKSIAVNLGVKDFVNITRSAFAKKVSKPRDSFHKDYIKKYKAIFNSLMLAADYLSSHFTRNASFLPYPPMLSILSVFFFNNKNKQPNYWQTKQINKWFWSTSFGRRYSGTNQAKNQMNDAIEMKKLSTRNSHKFNIEGNSRMEKVSISSLCKTRYNVRGAIRNAFFCYLLSKKPKEFENAAEIPIGEVSSSFNKKNDHHIFSRALLRRNGFSNSYIDRLGNICFLTFGDNIRAKDDAPWIYLKSHRRKGSFKLILKSHIIPHSKSILSEGDVSSKFIKFLNERERMISRDLSILIGKKFIES